MSFVEMDPFVVVVAICFIFGGISSESSQRSIKMT
jgi:hypothetical protein